jgi:hypothetical protein
MFLSFSNEMQISQIMITWRFLFGVVYQFLLCAFSPPIILGSLEVIIIHNFFFHEFVVVFYREAGRMMKLLKRLQ